MFNSKILAKATIWGTFWNYASFYSGRLVAFVSLLILARLLSKDDFGIAAFAILVMGLVDQVASLGIGQAIIYYREEPDMVNTAFWMNVASGIAFFILMWMIAPFVGVAFGDNRAVPVVRAFAFMYPLASLENIHSTLLQKRLSFGKKFIPDIASAIGKALISIPMALLGFGVWSLIIGQLAAKVISVISYWIVLPWRPNFRFSRELARKIMSYGLNSVVLEIISAFQSRIDSLMVGRMMGSALLGVYTLSYRIPEIFIMQFCTAVATVMFPIYTTIQDDTKMLQESFIRTVQYLTMITVPLGFGIAVLSKPIILVFYTEKWIEMVPVMQAIAIYAVLQSVLYGAGIVYKAKGYLKLMSIITAAEIFFLIPVFYFGIIYYHTIAAVAWLQNILTFILVVVELIFAVNIIKVSPIMLIKAIAPSFILGSVMVVAIYVGLLQLESISSIWQLVIGIPLGVIVYIGGNLIFQRKAVQDGISIFKFALLKG